MVITLDPNQTNDQQTQDQTGVPVSTGDQTPQAPAKPEPQVPVSEPTMPAEPVVAPAPEATTTDVGNMDGDTTPPIPGV